MKRFSKILTLILALAVIVTAFTVVALAEDAAEPKAVNVGGFELQTDFTHANWVVGSTKWGTVSGGSSGSGTSSILVGEAYPGGNKFLLITGTSGSTTRTEYNTFFGNTATGKSSYGKRTTYDFEHYPIVALDFDLMTPNGDWGLYSATNSGNSAGVANDRMYIGSSEKTNLPVKEVVFGNLGLPATPGVWYHVTVVYEYFVETVDNGDGTTTSTAYLRQNTYANGVRVDNEYCTLEKANLTTKYGDSAKDLWLGPLTVSTSRYETASQQAIDNIQYTYCQEGYDVSKLPTAIYNDSWVAPFGNLVATVTVGEEISYFDDMAEAVAFANANPGCTLAPKQKITANYTVDSAFTIDANIYGTDAETGETIITGKYTGFDTYAKTNVGYLMAETAEGSGIYVATMGDFMHTPKDSIGTAYTADQLVAKLRSPGSGSVIKLFADVEIDPSLRKKSNGNYEDGAISVTTDFTLDLNGHELRRVYYYGSEYVADENGVYPEEATAVAAKNGALFDIENKAAVLNITSTAGTNGKIYNVGVKCNTWVKNGEIESREITAFTHNMLIYSITGGAVTDISYTDIYAGKILGAVWGNNYVTFRMNHCNFYQMSTGTEGDIAGNGEWIIHLHGGAGYDVQVENSFFYLNAPTPDGYVTVIENGKLKYGTIGVIRITESAPSTASAKFTNCEIISADNCHSAGVMNKEGNNPIEFENCRFYNNDRQKADIYTTSHGSLSNYIKLTESHAYAPAPAEGWTTKTLKNRLSITYTVPDVSGWTATTDAIQSLDFGFGTKEIVCQFNQLTTKEVDVTVGENTVTVIPGITELYTDKAFRIYADTTTNALLNSIYLLKDASGNVYENILGLTADGKFAFDWETTALTASEQTMFVGGIKDVNFNLNFLTGFRYNLYLPVTDALTDIKVEGYEKAENTVFIYGAEYHVYYQIVGSAAAAEANTITATYKVDGTEYSQSWTINAVQYAQMLIQYPSYASEKDTAVKMIKFIKEAVLRDEDSTVDTTALDAIVTGAGFDTAYGTYTEGNANALDPIKDSIDNAYFVVYNGVVAYVFETDAEDISFSVHNEKIAFTRNENKITLEAMRIYDLIDPITITVGDTSVKFSMLDYLTAMEGAEDMELAKALYEFGLAADEYKKDIMADNNLN